MPDRLSGAAVVIRGGSTATVARLDQAFEDHFVAAQERSDLVAGYCLSVNATGSETLLTVAITARRPNGSVCPSTVEAIENAGFVVRPTPGKWERDGHCDVHLQAGPESKPSPDDLVRLSQAFGAAVPNPHRR